MGIFQKHVILNTTGFFQQLQLNPCTMKHAGSKLYKAAAEAKVKSQVQEEAIEMGEQEQQTPMGKNGKPLGLCTICDWISASHLQKIGQYVTLSHSTLWKHTPRGTKLWLQCQNSWLTDIKATVLIDYTLKMNAWNLPFSGRCLKEHADKIIWAKHGPDFEGIGKGWVSNFTIKHHNWMKPCWSSSLDDLWAHTVNPNNKEQFYSLFKDMMDGQGNPEEVVLEKDLYTADKTGIQKGIRVKEHAYAPTGASVQHQQCNSNCENIMVLPTICADGTYLTLVTIFKGDGFQVKWCQRNPLNSSWVILSCHGDQAHTIEHSPGYLKKGYTNEEIGVAWIKNFDKQTKAKANGRYWLLVVDGHNSHYTGFLEYAHTNKIHILCYPSHSMHIYQGLHVVMFPVLKHYWSDEWDKFERKTKTKVSKENFLYVYAAAHIHMFTPENIKAFFQKQVLFHSIQMSSQQRWWPQALSLHQVWCLWLINRAVLFVLCLLCCGNM